MDRDRDEREREIVINRHEKLCHIFSWVQDFMSDQNESEHTSLTQTPHETCESLSCSYQL